MSRKAVLPQSPRHILVFDEDWQHMIEVYGPHSASRRGVSATIRDIIHAFCRRQRARAEAMSDAAVGAADAVRAVDANTAERDIKEFETRE